MVLQASDTQWTPQHLIPPVITMVLAILMLVPVGSNLAGVVLPHFAMISTFYWMSRRPMLMSYESCAVIGLFLDLWMGGFLGLNMLLLILVRFFVMNQLKFYRGRSRFVHWMVFTLLSFFLFVLHWLVAAVMTSSIHPPQPFLAHWVVTALAYAPIGLMLGWVRRLVLPQ